jgi:hypothetical protein
MPVVDALVMATRSRMRERGMCRTKDKILHCLYKNYVSNEIFHAQSSDNGLTWAEDLIGTGWAEFGGIASDSLGNLHTVFTTIDDFVPSLIYRKYDAALGIWQAPVVLYTDEDYVTEDCTLTVDGEDNIHVAWSGTDAAYPDNNQVRYVKYTVGVGWGIISDLTTDNDVYHDMVTACVDISGNIFIAWREDLLSAFYMIYLDGAWSAADVMTADEVPNVRCAAGRTGKVYFTWINSTDESINMRTWDPDTGMSAPEQVFISVNDKQDAAVVVADCHGSLYVAWCETGATWLIYLRKYVPGSGWQAVIRMPTVAVDLSRVVFIGSLYPNDKSNTPECGYGAIFNIQDGGSYTVWYYGSEDLKWSASGKRIMVG